MIAYLLIIGIGMGCAFQNCMIILQGSVPKELVPTATTSMNFIQNIGGVVGIAVSFLFTLTPTPTLTCTRACATHSRTHTCIPIFFF